MTTFIVKTQSANNEMLLHSTMQKQFASTNIDEARAAYANEIKALRNYYATIDDLAYCPSDDEQSNAVYCSLLALVEDEDGDAEVEFIEDSELFYEK